MTHPCSQGHAPLRHVGKHTSPKADGVAEALLQNRPLPEIPGESSSSLEEEVCRWLAREDEESASLFVALYDFHASGGNQLSMQKEALLQNRPLPEIPGESSSSLEEEVCRWLAREDEESASLFVALYDFHASGGNQLSMQKVDLEDHDITISSVRNLRILRRSRNVWCRCRPAGDKVQVVSEGDGGDWCEVRGPRGTHGWVPRGFLAPLEWYHGPLSRHQAEFLLSSGGTGSFLVRASESSPGQHSISLRHEGRVFHYRISQDSEGKVYVTSEARFGSLAELVRHHAVRGDGLVTPLRHPVAPRAAAPPRPDQWELDRADIAMRHRLGAGQYGDVHQALWTKYNITVAVKTLKEETMALKDFLEEASIMKEMRHPNLVQLLGVCTREPPFYIVTEFMPGGNLLDYLRTHTSTLSAGTLLYMATQVASAMAYLESRNFIHRCIPNADCGIRRSYLGPKQQGREDVNDEERAGRPSTSTTDEKINEVEKMILANRRITVREVAEGLNISIGSCHSIFINDLGMRRVAAKFVPKLLNCDQKQHRMNIANEMLDSVRDNPNLLQRVITGDEAWVYGYDVDTKAQSSQWKLPHEPRPKKAHQVRSNVKVLLTVFFDCRGVVHDEFLPQGRTVNKEYYLQVMRNLREAIRQKRPDL
ncbi:ABL1 [Cordylochernes scorpioides]|uniref:Tyrosine-protein kinase n=1 Tax=Cordylochernes scorpioides TaxID=51811 RepID=A0ABY6L0K3_9ARAC|nr:ABL1 [Cordylochernes scorpioides]